MRKVLFEWLKKLWQRPPGGRLDRKKLGALGETFACRYLEKNNFAILERNYTCPLGEIDIIAREGETVVFVEVKSQYSHVKILPERKVDDRKQKKLLSLARYYRRIRLFPETPCRIDVITIRISPENTPAEIRHYKRAI